MNGASLEAFLARLYTDAELRNNFSMAPERLAREAGLDEAGVRAVAAIDREGLAMAAASYESKRESHSKKRVSTASTRRLWPWRP